MRAGAWKGGYLQPLETHTQAGRSRRLQLLTPLPAEPNQKLKVKSLAGAVQRSRLLEHGGGQGRDEDGYGAIRSIQVRGKSFWR